MAEPARKLWTLDEFLAFDDGTDTRHELIAGEIVAITRRRRFTASSRVGSASRSARG